MCAWPNWPAVAPFAPRTVYVGGGTPSALSVAELACLCDLLHRHVDLAKVEEFTFEANPGSVDAAKLELLRRRGVNRISFGVQSFQPRLLKLLGRIHGPEDGREAVRLARAAGFENVSLDLMHGLPTQSEDELRRDVAEAASLETEHVSAYGLSYEAGTPLCLCGGAGRSGALCRRGGSAALLDGHRTVGAGGAAALRNQQLRAAGTGIAAQPDLLAE